MKTLKPYEEYQPTYCDNSDGIPGSVRVLSCSLSTETVSSSGECEGGGNTKMIKGGCRKGDPLAGTAALQSQLTISNAQQATK